MAQFQEPLKVKMYMNYAREKLWEVIPESTKRFPWKKAEATALQQLLLLGQQALKWSLIVLFIFSSSSDIIYAVSRNKELLIPFGLFVGCLMTEFLKEASQELFRNSEERRLSNQFLGIGCFFVLVKIISTYFPLGGWVFLLHIANGGLMQVLWLWKSSPEGEEGDNRRNSLLEDGSTARNEA
ncbi:unnamed protein product [Ilex paraguariensis]|uniref:Uncharacterized protein n=1 Tax=Ilex paraguariensis TaxID=185542 RepID=A0ABC8SL72_9AQUA